ncbi:putative DNA-invertase from lambdoid prophage Rac [Clostridium tepidiprofundi DSM 19306]|uniref:Putative DNA-invertase from lambdoid prophage Rac n=1 Tax=Clostridium tepidiprofundi DSM 19306 TaxID=1121338 RepID=A0A151B7J5_9CLOT|nr:recombinase family protein [Clostridium tepidiprofundi]KYH35876.1 putative DNA-invertase from lambdoid prophage Rac [Clostridium tepidiprofundi DSM 19306]
MKKVALYCRVSSDDQKERDTIENQVEILHTYIEMKENLEIYNEYLDNGISGTVAFEQRPAGKQLIEDASKGMFNTVLVWKIDRFGRDTLSGLNAVEMLRKYDIEILSVTEPFDLNTSTGRFQFITYLNMAELERNNILDRMYLGATRAAKKGKWMGGIVPYGYIINKKGYLEINKEEAEIIKKIFRMYTENKMSTIDIAIYLNNANILSSCGKGKGKRTKGITGKWRSGSIQRILSNTTYKGLHYYGKRSTRRKELIVRKVPAIISEKVWEKAQAQKKENFIISKRNLKREFLLRKMIKCKRCGKTYYGVSYKNRSDVYVCSGKRNEYVKMYGIKCDNVNVNADMLEEQIWNDCLHILKKYDYYVEQMKKRAGNSNEDIDSDLKKLRKALNDKKSEKNNILTLFRKNIISEEEVEEQLRDIKREEKSISNLIESLENKINNRKHKDELISTVSSKLKTYYNKLDNLTYEDKYDLVRLLVKSIEVETVVEDGQKVPNIHVVYNLVKLDTYTDTDS